MRQSDPGPSKLAVGILLGAAVLLLATWHRLTTRYAHLPYLQHLKSPLRASSELHGVKTSQYKGADGNSILACRGPSSEDVRVSLEEDISARSLGDALDAEAAFQQKTIAEQLQARMDQAKAKVRNAPVQDRASIVREEVSET